MGLYAKYVLPPLIDLAMRNKDTARLRAECVPRACGEVVEIGIGSGLNLPFYSSDVQHVYGVDPSVELQQMARKRSAMERIKVEFISQSAEEPLPLIDASIDTVVLTWTLCSIPDALRALQQMKRILKPSGHLIFVEHGRSGDPGVEFWQDRITPLWKRIGGGCHLNRKIDDLIEAAGFQIVELKTLYLPGPRLMTYTYQGIAQPGVNIQSEPATLSNHGETGDESRIEGLAGDCREAEADANRETPRPASLRRLKLGTSIIPRGGRVKPDP